MNPGDIRVPFGRGHLRCRARGTGPPVLVNNGIGASLDLLEPFERALDGYQVIVWDPPGIGGSSPPEWPPSIPYVARAARRVLEHLGHDHADVIGLSWGGFVAQELALRRPEAVRRLVLVATAVGVTSRIGSLRALPIMLSNRRYTSPEYLQAVAPVLYGGDIGDTPDLLHHHAYLRHRHAPSRGSYLWQALAAGTWTSACRLGSIRQRCLVLGADDDPIAHVANSRRLARGIPDARLEIVRRGGHLFLLTRPVEMAELIADFLQESDPQP